MNLIYLRAATTAWTPANLFAASEVGAWFDPSDLSTMWQDTARTTPVTAVEQTVACIDDKSGNGFNATQTTSGNRPILRARYNLLTYSEQFDNAAWTKSEILGFGSGSTANATTAPDGTTTADLVVPSTANATHWIMDPGFTTRAGVSYKWMVYAKAAGYDKIAFREGGATGAYAAFDLGAGTVITSGSAGAVTVSGAAIESLANGWYKLSCVITTASSFSARFGLWFLSSSYSSGDPQSSSWTPNGTSGMYVWGADNRVDGGVSIPAYQRIAAATDYDTTGFPNYLEFDGTDDLLVTSSINPGSVDKMQVFTGIRYAPDGPGMIVEASSDADSNNGAFYIIAGTTTYSLRSRGTTTAEYALTAPDPLDLEVISFQADISGDNITVRRNGVLAGNTVTDQGAGNYSSYPLYIGRRAGGSGPFKGGLYGLIVRFSAANLASGVVTSAETWMNSKTGAY